MLLPTLPLPRYFITHTPAPPFFFILFFSLGEEKEQRERVDGGGREGGRGASASFSHPCSNTSLLGLPTSAQETSLCYHCQLAERAAWGGREGEGRGGG